MKTNRIFPKLTMKQTVTRVKGTGVIGSIMEVLKVAKAQRTPVTTEEITTVLHNVFPDRDATGMRTTVRVQLSRLPKEREFKLKRTRDGRNVRYSAA